MALTLSQIHVKCHFPNLFVLLREVQMPLGIPHIVNYCGSKISKYDKRFVEVFCHKLVTVDDMPRDLIAMSASS